MQRRTLIVALSVAFAATPAYAAGDAAKGERLFNRCKACHSLEAGKNRLGPNLAGLFGRTAGAVEGFNYSAAMKDSGVTWSEATLAEFLADPRNYIPRNRMTFPGLRKETERADLIAYLVDATKQ